MDASTSSPSTTPGRGRIWLAAAIPPLAWMLQGSIGWFIAAHACPSSREPLSLGAARVGIGVLSLVALVLAIAGLISATRVWRRLAPESSTEMSAERERVRFTAMVALVVCATLTLGLVLAGLPSLIEHACGEMR